ncbi:hypothetical protein B14911_21298 [Bacillus sp. NRRL B-14911]|nr:hypothetical protein B14911_21298 [Bacillus sp. NRRL B-14911]
MALQIIRSAAVKRKMEVYMIEFAADLSIVALLVIGITAIIGVAANGIGEKLFGGKRKSEFVDQSAKVQTGWKNVGGRK